MSTITLRPNAAGDQAQWEPSTGANYECVDEVSASDTDYVGQSSTSDEYDDYNIETSDLLTGAAINSVTVYTRSAYVSAGVGSAPAAPVIAQLVRVGSTNYIAASTDALTTTYTDNYYTWSVNPADSGAWEKADIDSLKVGMRSKRTVGGGSRTYTPRCSQVYVVVDYTVAAAPTVTTAACSSVTYNSATFNGEITATNLSNATRRGFCYVAGTSGDPTTSDTVVYDDGDFGTGTFNEAVGSLTAEGSYRVRAYAVNTTGTGYGTTVQLTLTDNPPTVALNTPADEGTTSDTTPALTFTGTDVGGDTITYEIQIDPSADFVATNAWDVSKFSYENKSYDVATGTAGVCFSPDGTKMYLADGVANNIAQYTLSTAWDVSTATSASKTMSVETQDSSVQSVRLSPDGTKAYIVGVTTSTVYQYTLSTAWDISTGSYATKSMSVATQDTAPKELDFSADGYACYVVGNNDYIYQYTLSTAWDISTGAYASKSKYCNAQENYILGFSMSSDGTKAYVVGTTNNTIYQYTLGTAWDISTASYASKSLSIATQTTVVEGMCFSADGSKIYVVSDVGTTYQYTSAPYIDKLSSADAGFVDVTDGTDTDPFDSTDQITYTVQSALAEDTYYWRVRGKDPTGSNTWGAWPTARSFTVSGEAPITSIKDIIGIGMIAFPR